MKLQKPLLASLLTLCLSAESFAAAKPNIIFVLTDDLGYGDVGVFYQKSREEANVRSKPWTRTPNLDAFAAEGAQLPNHYCAAPVCAPSRASILLGLSQGHANVRNNQFDKALENNHTIATVLKQAGYATVAVGKWGLQGGIITKDENHATADDPEMPDWPAHPLKRGFDDYLGYLRHSDGHEHYPKEAPYTRNHLSKKVWHGTTNLTPELDKCYTADLWTAWAKHWILDHQQTNAAQPFFMYLAYDTPHAVQELPTQAYPEGGGLHGGLQWLGVPGHMINTASGKIDSWIHPDYVNATYDEDHNPATPEVPWPDVNKRYATAIRRIDAALGDLKKLLQDLKIDQDTLVIFTSDNGPSIESYLPNEPLLANFFDSFGPFDGIKRDCWEGGLRMPTLARWPGQIPAGRVVDQPSISYDWLRTFASAAGVPAPAETDGVSLLPELTGRGAQADPGYLYVEYWVNSRTPEYAEFAPAHRGRRRNQMQQLRLGDYVGVRYDVKSQADPFEIYKVTVDPQETNNLAGSLPDLERKLKTLSLQVRRPDNSAPRPYDDELVPAVPAAKVIAGVQWQAYEGTFPWVPDFADFKPVASGTNPMPDLAKIPREDNVGLFFSGYMQIPKDGDYTFFLESDTGAVLRIHDAKVIDADFAYPGGGERSGSIRLQAGLHPFRLYYARRLKGKPQLNFAWSGPGMAKETIPAGVFMHQAVAAEKAAAVK